MAGDAGHRVVYSLFGSHDARRAHTADEIVDPLDHLALTVKRSSRVLPSNFTGSLEVACGVHDGRPIRDKRSHSK